MITSCVTQELLMHFRLLMHLCEVRLRGATPDW